MAQCRNVLVKPQAFVLSFIGFENHYIIVFMQRHEDGKFAELDDRERHFLKMRNTFISAMFFLNTKYGKQKKFTFIQTKDSNLTGLPSVL